MLGGVTVNVILAIIIFIFILWVWGEKYVPIANLKYGLYADSLGKKIGLMDGDRIIAVGGKPVEKTGTVVPEIIMNEPNQLQWKGTGRILKCRSHRFCEAIK
jgi:regulator of sigma E protease